MTKLNFKFDVKIKLRKVHAFVRIAIDAPGLETKGFKKGRERVRQIDI